MGEKLRQMGTASLRAYLDGANTLPMRRKTVMAYLNTVPLAAAPRFGEVNGVGDGLWAWYGLDFAEINRTLASPPRGKDTAYASALKHVLSLIVAERRPSYYLAANRKALDALTDDHLDLLANAGLLPRALADQAKQVKLRTTSQRIDPPPPRFVDQKATNAQRIRVAQMLGESRLYDLDRIDLKVDTTINQPAQKIVSTYLQSLARPEAAAASGLIGHRLLQPENPLASVIYSFTLYEKHPTAICCASRPTTSTSRSTSTARRATGSRLHRQAAHPGHLSGDHRAAARRAYRTLDAATLKQKAAAKRRRADAVGGRRLPGERAGHRWPPCSTRR